MLFFHNCRLDALPWLVRRELVKELYKYLPEPVNLEAQMKSLIIISHTHTHINEKEPGTALVLFVFMA